MSFKIFFIQDFISQLYFSLLFYLSSKTNIKSEKKETSKDLLDKYKKLKKN